MAHPTHDPQRLRRRRIEAGLNQRELAAKVEISESYMSCLALGTRNASPRLLKRFAKALNCQVTDLMPPEPETTEDTEAGAA